MRIQYCPFEHFFAVPGFPPCRVWGLSCWAVSDTAAVLLEEVEDVSPSAPFVSALAEAFTRLQLSPLHFREAVQDAVDW